VVGQYAVAEAAPPSPQQQEQDGAGHKAAGNEGGAGHGDGGAPGGRAGATAARRD